jgi:hypothetical protein
MEQKLLIKILKIKNKNKKILNKKLVIKLLRIMNKMNKKIREMKSKNKKIKKLTMEVIEQDNLKVYNKFNHIGINFNKKRKKSKMKKNKKLKYNIKR